MSKLKSAVLYEYLTKVKAIGIFYLIQYLIVALIFTIVAICTKGNETGSNDVDSKHYQCGYELRPERNPDYAGKQLFHSGLYGYGLVYDPGVAGHLYGTAESNGTLQ